MHRVTPGHRRSSPRRASLRAWLTTSLVGCFVLQAAAASSASRAADDVVDAIERSLAGMVEQPVCPESRLRVFRPGDLNTDTITLDDGCGFAFRVLDPADEGYWSLLGGVVIRPEPVEPNDQEPFAIWIAESILESGAGVVRVETRGKRIDGSLHRFTIIALAAADANNPDTWTEWDVGLSAHSGGSIAQFVAIPYLGKKNGDPAPLRPDGEQRDRLLRNMATGWFELNRPLLMDDPD